jgi:hypothetical protein
MVGGAMVSITFGVVVAATLFLEPAISKL